MRGAEDREIVPAGTFSCVPYPCPREGGAISNSFKRKCSFRFLVSRSRNAKKPRLRRGGADDPALDQSPARRDQISVKLSSPSTLTRDA
jgi:hypothetical protein